MELANKFEKSYIEREKASVLQVSDGQHLIHAFKERGIQVVALHVITNEPS